MINRAILILGLLQLLMVPAVHAQGGATDLLTGKVRDTDGHPLPEVQLIVTEIATELRHSTETDATGRYTVVLPGGAGRYHVRAERIGMAPAEGLAIREENETFLVLDLKMSFRPIVLPGLAVTASPAPDSSEGVLLEPAGIDDRASWARRVAAADPEGGGLELRLDGGTMDAWGAGVHPDAIESARLRTTSYDVASGGGAGPVVEVVTRRGTGRREGALSYRIDEHLRGSRGSGGARRPRAQQAAVSAGGPLTGTRTFFYGTLAVQGGEARAPSLSSQRTDGRNELRIAPDSIDRLRSILSELGIPTLDSLDHRPGGAIALTGRIDHTGGARHSLSGGANLKYSSHDGAFASSLQFPASGGRTRTIHNMGWVRISSRWSTTWVGELRAALSSGEFGGIPRLRSPGGHVRIGTEAENGVGRQFVTVTFGGNGLLPTASVRRSSELQPELTWLHGRHRVRLGAQLRAETSEHRSEAGVAGTYSFESLADLEAGRAGSYVRRLAPTRHRMSQRRVALYADDTWRPDARIQWSYGVRAERTAPELHRAPDPALERAFGVQTDPAPAGWRVEPRTAVTLRAASGRWTLRTGGALLAVEPSSALMARVAAAAGSGESGTHVRCFGESVPNPVWSPEEARHPHYGCLGETGTATPRVRRNAEVFAPGFSGSRSLQLSLGAERRLSAGWRVTLEAVHVRGTAGLAVVDRNLSTRQVLRLLTEGGRILHLNPERIDERTGWASDARPRLDTTYDAVLEYTGWLGMRSTSVTGAIQGTAGRTLSVRAEYMWRRSREEFMDPDGMGRGWGTGSGERRHTLVTGAEWQPHRRLAFSLASRADAGRPFTPLVNRSLSGGGIPSRGFVFDPERTDDPALAEAFNRLLTAGPPRIRRCLANQVGRVAGVNSCRGPATFVLDLRVTATPPLPRIGDRLTVTAETTNLGALAHLVLRGAGGGGWGSSRHPDGVLLFVNGFDPATGEFRYVANEGFGRARAPEVSLPDAASVRIQGKVTFGRTRGT